MSDSTGLKVIITLPPYVKKDEETMEEISDIICKEFPGGTGWRFEDYD